MSHLGDDVELQDAHHLQMMWTVDLGDDVHLQDPPHWWSWNSSGSKSSGILNHT